jgi:hypothetical protein
LDKRGFARHFPGGTDDARLSKLSSLRLLASHDSDAGAKPMTQSIIEALQRENAELRGRVDRFRKLLTTSSSRG